MAINVNLKNVIYQIPENTESPTWGEATTDYLKAIADAINASNGPNDLNETSANILNNQAVSSDLVGAYFNPAQVRSFRLYGSVFRQIDSTVFTETFEIDAVYTGTDWNYTISGGGSTGVLFTMTPAGQIQYTSSNLVGTTYSGVCRFRGIAVLKV